MNFAMNLVLYDFVLVGLDDFVYDSLGLVSPDARLEESWIRL